MNSQLFHVNALCRCFSAIGNHHLVDPVLKLSKDKVLLISVNFSVFKVCPDIDTKETFAPITSGVTLMFTCSGVPTIVTLSDNEINSNPEFPPSPASICVFAVAWYPYP